MSNKNQIQNPCCSRCGHPMAWHSDQAVLSRNDREKVHVFRCDGCNRLEAFSRFDPTASTAAMKAKQAIPPTWL